VWATHEPDFAPVLTRQLFPDVRVKHLPVDVLPGAVHYAGAVLGDLRNVPVVIVYNFDFQFWILIFEF
jgi:hypothetical protein